MCQNHAHEIIPYFCCIFLLKPLNPQFKKAKSVWFDVILNLIWFHCGLMNKFFCLWGFHFICGNFFHTRMESIKKNQKKDYLWVLVVRTNECVNNDKFDIEILIREFQCERVQNTRNRLVVSSIIPCVCWKDVFQVVCFGEVRHSLSNN